MLYIRPDIYIIMDEMYAQGEHSYEQYWNFSERGELEEMPGGCTFTGDQAKARLVFLTPGVSVTLGESRIARHYNRCETRKRLCVQIRKEGFASLITVIKGGEGTFEASRIPVRSALKGITYSEEMAEGVKIQAEGKTYVVIFCHQEVNSPTDLTEAEGCMGYGNVIVFEKGKDEIGGTVMCW